MSSQVLSFSIVIPTYGRTSQLQSLLDALSQLDWPEEDFEVIVVDDGSPMAVATALNESTLRTNVRIIRQAQQGPAAARNAGALQAKGRFLVLTDDDCIPGPDWLRAWSRVFAQSPDALLGGQTSNGLRGNSFSDTAEYLAAFAGDYERQRSDQPEYFASNNMALAKAGFDRVGGFNAEFGLAAGEDREFCRRWLIDGGEMLFVPDARVTHCHALHLASFWRQQFKYGRGAAQFHRLHARHRQRRLLPRRPSFYAAIILSPLGQKAGLRGLQRAALATVAQCAVGLGFFAEWFGLGSGQRPPRPQT